MKDFFTESQGKTKMCIISGPIRSVKNTKLFVLPNKDKTRQMTFYLNSVDSHDENMMILPVPNIDSLQLHTIKYKSLFKNLADSVYKIPTRSWNLEMNTLRSAASASFETLEVFSHGSYLVSIAPTLQDLFRLDNTIFDFTPELHDFFAKHYTSEFGYLCCKLKEGKQDYEPICYSHALHSNKKLFVPTLHYHNHHGRVDTEHADWDHLIYSAGTTKDANLAYMSNSENKINWKKLPEDYRYEAATPIRCAELEGHQPNRDIAFVIVE